MFHTNTNLLRIGKVLSWSYVSPTVHFKKLVTRYSMPAFQRFIKGTLLLLNLKAISIAVCFSYKNIIVHALCFKFIEQWQIEQSFVYRSDVNCAFKGLLSAHVSEWDTLGHAGTGVLKSMRYPLFYINPYKQDLAELSGIKACFVSRAPAGTSAFETFYKFALRDFGFAASLPLSALIATKVCTIPNVTSPAAELTSFVRNNFNSMKANFFGVLASLNSNAALQSELGSKVSKYYGSMVKKNNKGGKASSASSLKDSPVTMARINILYAYTIMNLGVNLKSDKGVEKTEASGFNITNFFNIWESSRLANVFIPRRKRRRAASSELPGAMNTERADWAKDGNILLNSYPRLFSWTPQLIRFYFEEYNSLGGLGFAAAGHTRAIEENQLNKEISTYAKLRFKFNLSYLSNQEFDHVKAMYINIFKSKLAFAHLGRNQAAGQSLHYVLFCMFYFKSPHVLMDYIADHFFYIKAKHTKFLNLLRSALDTFINPTDFSLSGYRISVAGKINNSLRARTVVISNYLKPLLRTRYDSDIVELCRQVCSDPIGVFNVKILLYRNHN